MATPIGDLVVRLGAQTRQFDQKMRSSKMGLQRFASFAKAAGVAVGFALAAGFSRALQAGERFNRAMQRSLAIMHNVSTSMRKTMEEAAFGIAASTRSSSQEVASSYFFLTSAGLNVEQSLAALPAVAKFAQAGFFDLSEATQLSTDALSALGMKVKDPEQNLKNLTRVMDTLVKANQIADANVRQFSLSLTTKAGDAARRYGQDLASVAAVLALMAERGIKAEASGERYDIILRHLSIKAVSNAKAFTKWGVAVFDNTGKSRDLIDVIEDLERATDGLSDRQRVAMLQELGFTAKTLSSAASLIGFSGTMREFRKQLEQAGGAMDSVSGKSLTPLQQATEELSAAWDRMGLSIMKIVGPIFGAFIKMTTIVIKSIDLLVNVAELALQKLGLLDTPSGPTAAEKAEEARVKKEKAAATRQRLDAEKAAAFRPALMRRTAELNRPLSKAEAADLKTEVGSGVDVKEKDRIFLAERAGQVFSVFAEVVKREEQKLGRSLGEAARRVILDNATKAFDASHMMPSRRKPETALIKQSDIDAFEELDKSTQSVVTALHDMHRQLEANRLGLSDQEAALVKWREAHRDVAHIDEAVDALRAAQVRLNDAAAGRAITRQFESPIIAALKQIGDIQRLLNVGAISPEIAARATAAAEDAMRGGAARTDDQAAGAMLRNSREAFSTIVGAGRKSASEERKRARLLMLTEKMEENIEKIANKEEEVVEIP